MRSLAIVLMLIGLFGGIYYFWSLYRARSSSNPWQDARSLRLRSVLLLSAVCILIGVTIDANR